MKKKPLTLFFALACAGAMADTATWIGGDKSAEPNGLFTAENWDVWCLTNKTDDTYIINQNNDYAISTSSTSGMYFNGPITVGGEDNPKVTVEFYSNRTNPPTNSNCTQMLLNAPFSLIGENATLIVHEGVNFSLGYLDLRLWPEQNHYLDPAATVSGNGVISFGTLSIPGRDFDELRLVIGSTGTSTHTLEGNASTKGATLVTANGTGGIDRIATLNLNGFDFTTGGLELGVRDTRADDLVNGTNLGNQSGFGSICLGGGTLTVNGDISFLGDPNGVWHDSNQTPLSVDSSIITDGRGGTIRLSGSMSPVTSNRNGLWDVADATLVFCGNGALQKVEALSEDRELSQKAGLSNYVYGKWVLEANSSVQLVDEYQNVRDSVKTGAVYVRELVIGENATLDLNGLKLYYYGSADIAASADVINGQIVYAPTTAPVTIKAFPLLTADNTIGPGHWIAGMVAGDFENNGSTTLFFYLTDEYCTDADDAFYAVKYANGQITPLEGFPITEDQFSGKGLPSASGSMRFDGFTLTDVGYGNEIFFAQSGRSPLYALRSNASIRKYTCWNNEYQYNCSALYTIADVDRDGTFEAAIPGRDRPTNIVAIDLGEDNVATERFSLMTTNGRIVSKAHCADLDGDGLQEFIYAETGVNMIHIYCEDGTPFTYNGTTFVDISLGSAVSEKNGAFATVDITGDGIPEILQVSGDVPFVAFSIVTAAPLFTITNTLGTPGFAIFDLENDGTKEILFGNKVYNGSGEELLTLPLPANNYQYTKGIYPVLADFNKDHVPEVCYFTSGLVNNNTYGRVLNVYDMVAGEMVDGFPLSLIAPQGAEDNLWYFGGYHHWNGSQFIVADLDGDSCWEIAVGVGTNRTTGGYSAELNIIDTPYAYKADRYAGEEVGWYQVRHDAANSSAFPKRRQDATLLILR